VVAVSASGSPAGDPESHEPKGDEKEASVGDPWGPAVSLCGSTTSTLADNAECGPRTPPREKGACVARDRRWDTSWRDDHFGAAGDGSGGSWAPESRSVAAPYRPDHYDRRGAGYRRHADVRGDHAWSAAVPGDGGVYAAAGHGGPA